MLKKIIIASFCCHMIAVHAGDRKEPVTPATPKTPSVAFSGQVPFRIEAPGLSHVAASLEKAATTFSSSEALAQATAALGLKEAAAALDLPKVAQALSQSPALERAVDKLKDIKITAALGLKEAAAALDLPKVAEALSQSPALERAVDKLKDIKVDVSSEALQQTAKILRSIDIQVTGSPQLRHSLTHKHTLTVPTITADQIATKSFGGIAFIYALTHGTHPIITGCLGCLTFAPYPMIKEASWKTYGALKNQLNRCFNHKKRQTRRIRPPLEIDLEAAKEALALIKAD